jgi:hypothetical protein
MRPNAWLPIRRFQVWEQGICAFQRCERARRVAIGHLRLGSASANSRQQDEALAYFNRAVEVASKIGDENLVRWAAMLDLADRAAAPQRPVAEMAYKLARCAEVTYEYVARDKHFDWE